MDTSSNISTTCRKHSRWVWLVAILVTGLVTGCGSGVKPVDVPDVNPSAAAAAALEQHDANGDGQLSRAELSTCPGILSVFRKYDIDKNGKVAAEEIAARIQYWRDVRVAILSLPCIVTLDGAPLAGAEVSFVPESYLGDSFLPAGGTTDRRGYAEITIAPEALPADLRGINGAHCGTYKIKITHPTKKIPARYNTETILGHETALDNHVLTPKQIALKSK